MMKEAKNRSFFQAINNILHQMGRFMAIFSGGLFLLLSIYITIDVISRKSGGPFSGVADEVASYVLAFGGTWALALALIEGRHVRIDVLLHLFSDKVNKILNLCASLLFTGFSGFLAWQFWGITLTSWRIGAMPSGSLLGVPLVYTQGLASIGLTTLFVQAILMSLKMIGGFWVGKSESPVLKESEPETHLPEGFGME